MIETEKAKDNFINSGETVFDEIIIAMLDIKKACAIANYKAKVLTKSRSETIIKSADLLLKEDEERRKLFCLDALSGSAGTSFNMNVNEAVSFIAAKFFKKKISPLNDVNKSQSTNDVFPTAVKIAVLRLLKKLEIQCASAQQKLQNKEKKYAKIIILGRTEYQDAVFLTLGQQFSAWAEAIARDRWRIYKCIERIRVVNLGGTAIGTGLNAPREYAYHVINELVEITGLNIVKAENLIDNTQNCDVFTEVSGILKANAVSLKKICDDIRFLSSGPAAGINELRLRQRQKGSTIMPSKINPVIAENIIQCAMLVFGLDAVLTDAVSSGHLQLNPFIPLIAYCLLKELKLLNSANSKLAEFIENDIEICEENIKKNVYNSYAVFTALVPEIGYEKSEELAKQYETIKKKNNDITVFNFLKKKSEISPSALKKIFDNVIK